jgi:predicted transcriptional regulator of viral defense system
LPACAVLPTTTRPNPIGLVIQRPALFLTPDSFRKYDGLEQEFTLVDELLRAHKESRTDQGRGRSEDGHPAIGGGAPGSGRGPSEALAVDRHPVEVCRCSAVISRSRWCAVLVRKSGSVLISVSGLRASAHLSMQTYCTHLRLTNSRSRIAHMEKRPTGGYGLSTGIALARSLADAGLYVFTTNDAVLLRPPDTPPSTIPYLLKALADADWIIRLRRGLYAGTGRLPGEADVPPFVIATSLVQPSAVAHLSALAHHGLTDQIPLVVSAITPRKVVLPSMRGPERTEGRHLWRAAGLDFRYVTIILERFSFGIETIWLDERFRVPITDRERTVLDLFALPRLFGGLGEGLSVLERAQGEIDIKRLVDYAIRYDSTAVAKRLGWSLEETGTDPSTLLCLLELSASGYSVLDPGRARRGRHDRRWMIIDNRTEDRA